MNVTRVSARNFRTYGDVDLTLPEGCVAIVGENGSGKSSLLMLVDLGLFGPPSRSFADFVTEGEDELELTVEFEHAGAGYRVRRQFKRGKATLDFEQWIEENGPSGEDYCRFEPLTRESARETQELIERVLGLSRETFCASALLRQGDSGAFTEAQPRDRKRILGEVIGLDRYDTLLELAKQDRRAVEREISELEGADTAAREAILEKDFVEQQLRISSDIEREATADLAKEVAGETAAREQVENAKVVAAERAVAAAAVDATRVELTRLEGLKTAAENAREAVQESEELLAGCASQELVDALEQREAELREAHEAYRAAIAERTALLQQREQAAVAIEDLERRAGEADTHALEVRSKLAGIDRAREEQACDRCGRVLDADSAATAAQSLRDEISTSQEQAHELRQQAARVEIPDVPDDPEPLNGDALANIRQELADARASLPTRATEEERIRQAHDTLEATPADLPELLATATTAMQSAEAKLAVIEPVDLGGLERALELARRGVEQERDRLAQAQQSKARYEERLAAIHQAEQKLALTAGRLVELRDELDVVLALERAFGRDGIPALIIESSAIPFLETEATRILQELGTGYQVELRTLAALKSGDGHRDTLDVIVIADEGERPYETFSGGERTRINLALRIALARLLAIRRGAESRLLAIDEPEFLDEQGTAALVDVLRGLPEFRTTFLISHTPGLRDAFDQTLEIVKENGRSRILTGDTQAVPA